MGTRGRRWDGPDGDDTNGYEDDRDEVEDPSPSRPLGEETANNDTEDCKEISDHEEC